MLCASCAVCCNARELAHETKNPRPIPGGCTSVNALPLATRNRVVDGFELCRVYGKSRRQADNQKPWILLCWWKFLRIEIQCNLVEIFRIYSYGKKFVGSQSLNHRERSRAKDGTSHSYRSYELLEIVICFSGASPILENHANWGVQRDFSFW